MKRHLTSGLALALIAGLALTGCTKSADSAPTAAASSIPAVDPSRVSPTDLPTPPVVKDPKGAIRDLTLGDCKTDAGQQTVSGSITSTQAATADFLVTIRLDERHRRRDGPRLQGAQEGRPGRRRSSTSPRRSPRATQCVKGVEYQRNHHDSPRSERLWELRERLRTLARLPVASKRLP